MSSTAIVYVVWGFVGVALLNRLVYLHSPWWLYALVLAWGLLCGLWSFLQGMGPGPKRVRR